jgi:hypothetical protein
MKTAYKKEGKNMLRMMIFLLGCFSLLCAAEAFAADPPAGIVVSGGNLKISDDGYGLAFPDGTVQYSASTPGASGVIGNTVQVNSVYVAAGETANVATLNLSLLGNRTILVLPTISGLTWGPSPAEYGGHNHSLHVNVRWKIIAGGYEIASFLQTAEQNVVQLQGAGFPTTAGQKAVTLQAVNSSYWSLDDAPGGTTPIGTNSFSVMISAMEL